MATMPSSDSLDIFHNLPFSTRNMDIDITHLAIETEGSMLLWRMWTASRPLLLEELTTCDDPTCVGGGGCDPLPDYMSCIRCFDKDDDTHHSCSWRDQYLSMYLSLSNPDLSSEELQRFLGHYSYLKNSPRHFAVPPGLDGKMYAGLRDASRLLKDLREDPTIKASPRLDVCIKSLEATMSDLRIHNLYIALETLQAQKRWHAISRIVGQSLKQLFDTQVRPIHPAHETGRDILKRCVDLDLLYKPTKSFDL